MSTVRQRGDATTHDFDEETAPLRLSIEYYMYRVPYLYRLLFKHNEDNNNAPI